MLRFAGNLSPYIFTLHLFLFHFDVCERKSYFEKLSKKNFYYVQYGEYVLEKQIMI